MSRSRSMPSSKSKTATSVPPHIVGNPSALVRRPPTRERILIAAEAVWNERGYAQASVEDVLRAADVARATFYQYFTGKEDLAAALFERAISFLLATATERFTHATTLRERISTALETFLELWQKHGGLVQQLSLEALRPGSTLGPARKNALEAATAAVAVRVAVDVGVQVDPVVIRHLLLGIEGLLMHMQIDEPLTDATRPDVHAALLPIMLRALGVES